MLADAEGTIHELRNRLQVDPRRGLAAGMAGAARSRRLLPAGRQLRHDRPDLQSHHGAHSGLARPPADQSLRPALQGDHRVEPGEDRRRGRHRLEARHRLRHQQVRLRDPRRDPQGAAEGAVRAAHAHARRHGGGGDEMRAAAAVADLDPLRTAISAITTTRARRSISTSASVSSPISVRTTR